MSRRGDEVYLRDGRPVPIQWLDPVAGSPTEVVFGSLLLVVIGLVGMVWGAALLSSWLIVGDAAPVDAADAGIAMVRLGANGFRWENVWSPEIEAALPDPEWFWTFFIIEAVVISLLFWPLWRLWGPRVAEPLDVVVGPGKPNHPRTVKRKEVVETRRRRDADRRAVATGAGVAGAAAAGATVVGGLAPGTPATGKIVVDAPSGDRLILGRSGRHLLAAEPHHSVLALGPTRSGKTTGLAMPAVLEWAGPAVVLSAKSDMITMAFEERRRRGGDTWLYDPAAAMANASTDDKRSFRGDGWSPLHMIASVPQPRNEPELDRRVRQWSLARRSASWMVQGVRHNGDPTAPQHYAAAEQILAPLLLAAAAEEYPIDQVVEWIDTRDVDGIRGALDRTGVAEATAAWESAHRFDTGTTTAAYQVLTSVLYPFGDPVVAAQAQNPTISARNLLNGDPHTLFVLATPVHQQRLRPVLTTLLSELFDAAMAAATVADGGRLNPPLLIVIDDAATCLPLELIDQLASTGAGIGVQLLSLFGDLGHLAQTYGPDGAMHLADSHRARVVLPGVTDPFTLDYLNRTISGNLLIDPDLPPDRRSDPSSVVGATASWLRTLEDGAAVLMYGNLAPIRMKLRPWYGEPTLRDRLHPPPERLTWLQRVARFFNRSDHDGLDGIPNNPLDSAANDRESTRYWDSLVNTGTLPEPVAFDDGTGGTGSSMGANTGPIIVEDRGPSPLRRFISWLFRR